MKKKDIVLEVLDAFTQDIGFGRARIDYQTRIDLDVSIGDPVVIEGAKTTDVIVWRAHPTDEGKKTIRIDKSTRINAGTKLGEPVKIRKATAEEKKKITEKCIKSKHKEKKIIQINTKDRKEIKPIINEIFELDKKIDCLINTMGRLENNRESMRKIFWKTLSERYDLDKGKQYKFNKMTYEIEECNEE
jgi:hypothetical protein